MEAGSVTEKVSFRTAVDVDVTDVVIVNAGCVRVDVWVEVIVWVLVVGHGRWEI